MLAADGRMFRTWARLMRRWDDRLIENALVAATAPVHGLTVVTRMSGTSGRSARRCSTQSPRADAHTRIELDAGSAGR